MAISIMDGDSRDSRNEWSYLDQHVEVVARGIRDSAVVLTLMLPLASVETANDAERIYPTI